MQEEKYTIDDFTIKRMKYTLQNPCHLKENATKIFIDGIFYSSLSEAALDTGISISTLIQQIHSCNKKAFIKDNQLFILFSQVKALEEKILREEEIEITVINKDKKSKIIKSKKIRKDTPEGKYILDADTVNAIKNILKNEPYIKQNQTPLFIDGVFYISLFEASIDSEISYQCLSNHLRISNGRPFILKNKLIIQYSYIKKIEKQILTEQEICINIVPHVQENLLSAETKFKEFKKCMTPAINEYIEYTGNKEDMISSVFLYKVLCQKKENYSLVYFSRNITKLLNVEYFKHHNSRVYSGIKLKNIDFSL